MNIYNSRKILFILFLYLCTTIKEAARSSKTKITDTNKQSGFLSFIAKPFQSAKINKIDMESVQKHTMEYVHKRLMLFIQNLDQKIFFNNKFRKSKILERVSDKKTTLSFQWQDIKSHSLIPIAKKHIRCYTIETIKELEKIKKVFFSLLKPYFQKLRAYYTDKLLIIENDFNVKENPDLGIKDKDLLTKRLVLHAEMASLLLDLPDALMFWDPMESVYLDGFANVLGPLSKTDGTDDATREQTKDDDDGDDDWVNDGYAWGFGGEVSSAAEEKEEKASDQDSDESSDSSSDGSGSDYNTEYFDNLPRDYFIISDDETTFHQHEESRETFPVLPDNENDKADDGNAVFQNQKSSDPSSVPSDDDTAHNDEETHDYLKSVDEDSNWEIKGATARQRQLTEGSLDGLDHDAEINVLRNRLLDSVLEATKRAKPELMKMLKEDHPELCSAIDEINKIKLKKKQEKLKSQPSSPSPGESLNPVHRPATPTAHPTSEDSGPHPPQSGHHSEGTSPDLSVPTAPHSGEQGVSPSHGGLPPESGETLSLAGRTAHLGITGRMSVQQEKQEKQE